VEANCVEYLGEKKEMPSRDSQGRICGFLDVDEAGKRKKFVTRFVILDKERNVLEWYTNDPSVSSYILMVFILSSCHFSSKLLCKVVHLQSSFVT